MRNPATILVKNEELTLDGIKQFYIPIDKEEWKFLTLVELYKNLEIQQCIIFCNMKQQVDELSEKFKNENFVVSVMVSHNPTPFIAPFLFVTQISTAGWTRTSVNW